MMTCKIDDKGTYPPEHLDLSRMNRVMRHRLRNLCCGMKMALERVSDQTREKIPNVGDNCSLMISELENLLTLTNRMDLLFDSLPPPEPESLLHLVSRFQQFVAKRHPICSFKMVGPEIDVKILPGNLVRVAVEELLANAGELSNDDTVVCSWEHNQGLTFTIENAYNKPLTDDLPLNPPQPFFTQRGRHDGLGLAIVQRVADAIGGQFQLIQDSDNRVKASLKLPVACLQMKEG